MTNLTQLLLDAGIQSAEHINSQQTLLTGFCDTNQSHFAQVLQLKPEKDPLLHVLGLTTKSHLESLQNIERQKENSVAMQKVFDNTVGETHGRRFSLFAYQQLQFNTHLWLFVQGRLNMDFSLADEYAHQTAHKLATLKKTSELTSSEQEKIHQLRSEFLASFYQGRQKYRQTLSWWQRIFKR